ncbi:ATP-grasp domain-containing protein [Rhodospira trueperi]|uniref:Predicted ATP-dependent carboligase, ATP-grasp superfamily n=1 Tax=Rhodospira trueperi TaxID=69960 RepID=A0A1G7DBR8_9PROT|nr:ATP-grasp domain-containing protein [Rhodospira trueperi]SDE48185.1 Predicted ATP-dependent carboligase, ATP-grasp superfamily [Rhodospira trueperi]
MVEPDKSVQTPAPGRVVLTHGRSLMALAVARSLGQRGIEVIGCDETPMMALSFSRYVTRTFLHDPKGPHGTDHIDSLAQGVRDTAPSDGRPYVLMPIHEDTPNIAARRDLFEPVARVAAPTIETIDAVFPKHNLARTLERLGVEAPPTRLPDSAEEARRAAEDIGFPVFVKPASSTGGRGIARVEDAADMAEAFEAARLIDPDGTVLVQGLADGEDYCLTALYQDGVPRVHMAYRNLETFPGAGGFGVLRETVDPGPMPAVAERLLGPLGWTGVVQLDFRWDGTAAGTPRLIEVNPRFWGGLFQSIESGVDYPWLLYRMMVDGTVPAVPEVRLGQRTKVPLVWILGAIEDLAEDGARFDSLEEAWARARTEARSGGWWRALTQMAGGLGDALVPAASRQRFESRWQRAESARSELFTADDPLAGLGLLYAVGSLVRNGRLPEEFSR